MQSWGWRVPGFAPPAFTWRLRIRRNGAFGSSPAGELSPLGTSTREMRSHTCSTIPFWIVAFCRSSVTMLSAGVPRFLRLVYAFSLGLIR